jgi:outer membrane lipoprotein-sorting protein
MIVSPTMKRAARISVLLLALLLLSGCLFRTRKVEIHQSLATLRTATRQELIDLVNKEASQVKNLNATVNIATSVGGQKKGKVTDYTEIRGYILLRKPETLRMIGLMPFIRTKAFDMVSNGQTFKLWIPPKNKFYIGRNDVVIPSANTLENLRPDVIYNALMVHEVDPQNDIAVLETSTQIVADPKSRKSYEEPNYILDVISRGPKGWYLARKIYFQRTDLLPSRQVIYDQLGNIATDARYFEFHEYAGVNLPFSIEITRPIEEYKITISMVKLALNQPLTDEQFTLNQPEGSQVVRLDQPGVVAQDGAQHAPDPQ